MHSSNRHTLLCHKMPCLTMLRLCSGPPQEWAGGLHASEPSPCSPSSRGISSSLPAFLLHFLLSAFSNTPCSRSPSHCAPWGLGAALAGALCCCSSLVTVTAGTLLQERPITLPWVGAMPCTEPGILGGLTMTPFGQIPASPGICWGLIVRSLLEIFISQNSLCKSFTFLLSAGMAILSSSPLWLSTGG